MSNQEQTPSPAMNGQRQSRSRLGIFQVLVFLGTIAFGFVFAFPIYILITVALAEPSALAQSPLGPPWPVSLDKFPEAWQTASLASAFVTSLVVGVFSIALLVIVGSASSYALVRAGRSRFRPVMLMVIILGITIPSQLGMVPFYRLLSDLGLLGNPASLIIYNVGALLPLTVFLYAGFISTQSRAFEEAAMMDGASHFQIYRKIMLPLLAPVTGTVIIINSVTVWNDFLSPLLFLGSRASNRTLPVAIYSMRGEYATDWSLVFAAILISILPIVIVFLFLQRYIINGFAGGLRG